MAKMALSRMLRSSKLLTLTDKIKWRLPTRLMSTSTEVERKDVSEGRHFSEIPGPKSLPIIGTRHKYLPYIGEYDPERPVQSSGKKLKKYGNIVREEILPGLVHFDLYNPADIEKMLRSTGKYPARPPVEPLRKYRNERGKANGLAEVNGKEWHRLRLALQKHMMSNAFVQSFIPLQAPISDDLVRNIRSLRDPNTFEIDDLMNDLYKWALESISVMIFGERMGCMELHLPADSLPQRFIDTIISFLDGMGEAFRRWPLHKNGKSKEWKQFVKDVNFLYEMLEIKSEECLNGKQEWEAGVVPLLTALTANETISKDDIQTAIADMYFGGADNTSTTLGFIMYNLAKHPEVQEKLCDEMRHKIPPGTPIVPTSFDNALYLKAVVKETFRLYPTSRGNVRTLKKDTVLAGYKVPEGAMVITQHGAAGLSDKFVEEPHLFKPERWLRSEGKPLPHPFTVMPFGHGPRTCIGKRFAEQEIYIGTATISRNFRIEYHHEDIGLKLRNMGYPDKPLRFTFIDREESLTV